MEENKEFIRNSEKRGLAVGRLLELISMYTKTIQRHRQAGSPHSIINQYIELRAQILNELSLLMEQAGISVQLQPVDRAA